MCGPIERNAEAGVYLGGGEVHDLVVGHHTLLDAQLVQSAQRLQLAQDRHACQFHFHFHFKKQKHVAHNLSGEGGYRQT
jgi:tmRNA-binding protein